jgi:hypothetical protein
LVIYLNTLLSSPDIISLIKSRRVGEDRGACSVLWRDEKYMETYTVGKCEKNECKAIMRLKIVKGLRSVTSTAQ